MPDRNVEIMQQLYSKLTAVFSVGTNSATSGSFLMLENPGTFLDPDFELANVDNEYLWAKMLNRIPQNTWVFQDTGREIDDLYEAILTYKELPIHQLTAAQQQQLTNARTYLGIPGESRYYRSYKKYRDAYLKALVAYNNAIADSRNRGVPVPADVLANFQSAQSEWVAWGYKNDVEKHLAVIANLTALDPNNWWANLQRDFDGQLVQASSGGFYRTLTFPSYRDFQSDDGWTTFTMTEEDIVRQNHSSHVDVGGGISGGWGLWKASASGAYSQDTISNQSEIRNLSLSVQIKRVSIIRDWLDPLVFRTRAWRWSNASPVPLVISDGGNITSTPPVTPNGEMPFFPVSMLLARNLVLTGDFIREEYQRIDTSFSTKVSLGWGPFSFGGRYNKNTTDEYFHGQRSGNVISCPGVQIIGHICDVLPRSPWPNPTLNWPTPMQLDHLPEYSAAFIQKLAALQAVTLDESQDELFQ